MGAIDDEVTAIEQSPVLRGYDQCTHSGNAPLPTVKVPAEYRVSSPAQCVDVIWSVAQGQNEILRRCVRQNKVSAPGPLSSTHQDVLEARLGQAFARSRKHLDVGLLKQLPH